MKIIVLNALCLFLVLQNGFAQMASDKSGGITNNSQPVAEVKKYDGNASVRPKFWVVSATNDSILHINFKKDLDSDWMQFDFKKAAKIVEVNTGEVITGLNYRKNIAAFLLKNNLITPDGKICDTAFERFAGSHTENLTEKYHNANEFNRQINASTFWYEASNKSLQVNGKTVGYIDVPDGQGVIVEGIVLYDQNKKVMGKGARSMFDGAITLTNGTTVKVGTLTGNTMNANSKREFITALLKDLCYKRIYPL
jgi:hypothetical protein